MAAPWATHRSTCCIEKHPTTPHSREKYMSEYNPNITNNPSPMLHGNTLSMQVPTLKGVVIYMLPMWLPPKPIELQIVLNVKRTLYQAALGEALNHFISKYSFVAHRHTHIYGIYAPPPPPSDPPHMGPKAPSMQEYAHLTPSATLFTPAPHPFTHGP